MSEIGDAAAKFKAMHELADKQTEGGFGGAFVVVPPKDGGEPLETLILDSRQDPVQFWILLKTKCESEIAALDQRQRTQQGFGGRSR